MLQINDLHKAYGDKSALQGVSFSVSPGQMFGFVGANGSGKTTTMRIIMGVLAGDAGEVTWQGRRLSPRSRRGFGYMPEERGLYQKMKVGDQIQYFGRLAGLSAPAARKATGDWLELLGLTERRNDPVQALSLGNQQRAQLAVALIHDPEVLILDEPFSGLDPIAVDALASVLERKRDAGVPIIFSSHQLDLVERLSDAVGIIKSGRMIATGPVDEVRSREGGGRLRIRVRDAQPGWVNRIPGRLVALPQPDMALMELNGAGDQEVLHAALREGHVDQFGWDRPSLTEIFREVVA